MKIKPASAYTYYIRKIQNKKKETNKQTKKTKQQKISGKNLQNRVDRMR